MMCLGCTSLNAKAQGPYETIEELDFYIWEAASEFDFSPYILKSLIWQESGYKGNNLTQIMYVGWFKEATDYIGSKDISNPSVNIRICAYTLSHWAEENEGEPALWLMMWNEGPDTAKAHYNPDKPSYYARAILKRAEEWEEEKEKDRK